MDPRRENLDLPLDQFAVDRLDVAESFLVVGSGGRVAGEVEVLAEQVEFDIFEVLADSRVTARDLQGLFQGRGGLLEFPRLPVVVGQVEPVFDHLRFATDRMDQVGLLGLSGSVGLTAGGGSQPPGDLIVGHCIPRRLGTLVAATIDHVVGQHLHRLGAGLGVGRIELGQSLPDF